MHKIQFKTTIKAPAQKVYETMLGLQDKATYEAWTALFNPTSSYEGNWEAGTKMYFIGVDDQGKRAGMISEIADHRPAEFVSIRHIGMLEGDTEILSGPQVEPWAGSLENYSFQEENGHTTVTVEMDVDEAYMDYFNGTWPKALETLKSLAEQE